MKRTISIILILALVMGLCSTAVYASPVDNDSVKSWILSDNGVNIYVKVLQYPKVTVAYNSGGRDIPAMQPAMQEIILEMDLELSQKYFQSFESGAIIPEIALIGINSYSIPSFKLTLNNCTVCGYTITEFRKGKVVTAPRAVVKLGIKKITAEKTSANNSSMQIRYADKLDTGKLTLNGVEDGGTAVFSGFDGYSMVTENTAGARTYGASLYNSSEMYVKYDQIGTLPDWLSSLDMQSYNLAATNPYVKLRFEYSSPLVNKKMILEADLTVTGQELKDYAGLMFAFYTFEVTNLDFTVTTSDVASTPVMTVSPVTALSPLTTISPMIKDSNLRRIEQSSWAGNWITTFGKMILKQNGASVSGEYGNPVETLEGTTTGNRLSGTWRDSLSTGKFEFTMTADGNAFTGTMYNDTLGDRGTQEWNGDRQ